MLVLYVGTYVDCHPRVLCQGHSTVIFYCYHHFQNQNGQYSFPKFGLGRTKKGTPHPQPPAPTPQGKQKSCLQYEKSHLTRSVSTMEKGLCLLSTVLFLKMEVPLLGGLFRVGHTRQKGSTKQRTSTCSCSTMEGRNHKHFCRSFWGHG